MQIALARKDFQAMVLLPRALQRKGVFLWQFAEVAWQRRQAVEVLDHLLCLLQTVAHVHVLIPEPTGVTVISHAVFDPDAMGLEDTADWPSIVASSIGWARDFILTFEHGENDPWRAQTPLFTLWAYSQADYGRLRR